MIVGAGWLDEALGQRLLTDGYHIQMTSRNIDKATQPDWALLNCESDKIQHSITLPHGVWIFCIPAGRTAEKQTTYRKYLKATISLAKQLKMKAFILCSTTGVYPDTAGIYRESNPIIAQSDRQARLFNNEVS